MKYNANVLTYTGRYTLLVFNPSYNWISWAPIGEEKVKVYKIDPTNQDSDGDSLSDWEEVEVYRTDPLKVDTDNDWLTDYEEAKVWNSNPLSKDSDGDGWNDFIDPRIWIEDNPPNVTSISSSDFRYNIDLHVEDDSLPLTFSTFGEGNHWNEMFELELDVTDLGNGDYHIKLISINPPGYKLSRLEWYTLSIKDANDNEMQIRITVDLSDGSLKKMQFTPMIMIGGVYVSAGTWTMSFNIVGTLTVLVFVGLLMLLSWEIVHTYQQTGTETMEHTNVVETYTDVFGNTVYLEDGGYYDGRGYGWELIKAENNVETPEEEQNLLEEIRKTLESPYEVWEDKNGDALGYRCHISYATTADGLDKSWGFVVETDENDQVLRFRWLSEYSINSLVGVDNPYEHCEWKLA